MTRTRTTPPDVPDTAALDVSALDAAIAAADPAPLPFTLVTDETTSPEPDPAVGAADAFDFGAMGDTQDHTYHPRHPVTREPVRTVTFVVAGEDTPEYRTVVRQAQAAMAAAERARPKGAPAPTAQEAYDAFTMAVAVGVVKAWENVRWGGEVMECTPANKRKLFTERRYVFEDLREFLNDREARLGKS